MEERIMKRIVLVLAALGMAAVFVAGLGCLADYSPQSPGRVMRSVHCETAAGAYPHGGNAPVNATLAIPRSGASITYEGSHSSAGVQK